MNPLFASLVSLMASFAGMGGGGGYRPNPARASQQRYSGTGMGGSQPAPWSLGSNAPNALRSNPAPFRRPMYNSGYSLGNQYQMPGQSMGGQMYQGNNATKRNAARANAGGFSYNSGYS